MPALGIPGSSTTAIMFGALMIHGLIPGPSLFAEHGNIAYTFLFGMVFTVLFMLVIGIYGIPLFSQILRIRTAYIIPVVVACSLIGAYSVQNSIFDITIAVAFGIIGALLSKADIPTAPIVLGLILGSLIEQNLLRTLTITTAKGIPFLSYILSRPMSIVILILTVVLIYTNLRSAVKQKREAD